MSSPPRRIASAANAQLVRLRRLAADPGAYRRLGEVALAGDHLCTAFAERGGRAALALLSEPGADERPLRELARCAEQVAIVAPGLMAAASALDAPPHIVFILPWRGDARLQAKLPSLVLDRLQDAGNVGTLLRSAAAFGFTQVLALTGTAALWSPRVLRAGMGAHFALDLAEGLAVEDLAALEMPLLATSSHAAQAIDSIALPWPCAFAFGNEGRGLAADLRVRCSAELRIAQPGGGESLNVAAAAAICLYESARQRGAAISPSLGGLGPE
jgi:RNA methyltransferase, TrmH family